MDYRKLYALSYGNTLKKLQTYHNMEKHDFLSNLEITRGPSPLIFFETFFSERAENFPYFLLWRHPGEDSFCDSFVLMIKFEIFEKYRLNFKKLQFRCFNSLESNWVHFYQKAEIISCKIQQCEVVFALISYRKYLIS